MKLERTRITLISLLVSMAVYFTLTWPLGSCLHDGIPSSNRPEAGGARYMIPGDHLQFLYQLWMLADSVTTGQTPLFYHVYEFNQGNDQALYNPGSYYFPFGLVYTAGFAIGGRVIGWNVMLLLTVWLTFLATWLLLRRYTTSWLTAGVAALPSILLPYFYVSLLGGSPTGLGMLWVPLIFLGIDVAIRDRKLWGGVLAGILLFIASWVDLHVFFFVFLAAPVWVLMCVAVGTRNPSRESGECLNRSTPRARRFLPLLPIFLGMIGAYLQTSIIKSSLDHTLQSEGRSIKESLGYALRWTGWFDTTQDNHYNIIYFGVWMTAILLVGLGFMVADVLRRKTEAKVRLAMLVVVLAAIGGIALLALGPNTPFDHEHRLWKLLRTVIPPYKMIRQPAKIYCILTPFMGLALTLVMDRFNRSLPRRVWVVLLAAVIAAGCLVDYGHRLDPTICLLDYEQGGYRAVAQDAAACGRENRAMAIPLWPGDSHWNSITEYYATLYRTKMLNGYSPSVSRQYFTDIFQRFEAINMGVVTDDSLDGLLAMKIGYLILHEDAFPQKVSPFPAAQTLRELMRHPRLEFLAHDKAVWSFKILQASKASDTQHPTTNNEQSSAIPLLAAWQWDACDMAGGTATVEKDGVNIFMRLPQDGGTLRLDPRDLYPLEGLRYVASVSGNGRLEGSFGTGLSNDAFQVEVTNGNQWGWVEIPVPALREGRQTRLELAFTNTGERVDISMITLMAGPWKWLNPGERLVIPAEAFCGTGYSDTNHTGVHLDKDRAQASIAFFAPVVPVVPGWYCITLDYSAAALAGLPMGELSVLRSDGQERLTVPVLSGREAVINYRLESPRPLRMEFRYSRAADMVIHSITLTRME